MTVKLLVGDVRDRIREIPDGSVDLVACSPPFLALRKYGDNVAEMGSERTPADFLDALLELTQEFRRVLAPHGSIAIELGDTYSGSGGAGGDYNEGGLRDGQAKFRQVKVSPDVPNRGLNAKNRGQRNMGEGQVLVGGGNGWPLAKSLTLIPTLYPASLAYGWNMLNPAHTFDRWRVRNVIVWARPNPPVGALGDKVRPATSHITVACTSARRYFDLDAVREPGVSMNRDGQKAGSPSKSRSGTGYSTFQQGAPTIVNHPAGAPPLDWWEDDDPTGHATLVLPTQPYPGAHYACVDDQTEALTPFGWKRHADLTDGDQIAAYDRTTRTVRWESATFHRYRFDGELVAIDKRETSQRLTPNHRVLYRTREGVEHVARADEVLPSHQVPVAAPFDIGGRGMGEDWAALLGWYITEGSAGARSAYIYQSETANPKHCNRIRDLLQSTKAEYIERRRVRPIGASLSPSESVEVTWTIKGLVGAWLLATAPAKRLTAEVVFGWSEAECVALLDALIDGDGHTRAGGRRQFIQKDTATIDMVQALCCRLGYRSTLSLRSSGTWNLTIGERKWLSLRGADGVHVPLGREHYTGTVWCPSVPSTFWLARRNGRPFITGNTWPEALASRLIKMMCPLRVCTTCGEPSRRIVGKTSHIFELNQLAAHIAERREATGKRSDLVRHFPHYKNADSVTAQFSNWERGKNVPSITDWQILTEIIGVSPEFDELIAMEQSLVEYGHISDHPSGTTQDATGRIYNRLPATKSRHAPDRWSDCGHNTWRPGMVLDPFAGSGTTLAVAQGLARDATGIELYPANSDLCRDRIGMFLEVA